MAELVEVKNLKKYFNTPRGMLHAVDDVSLNIKSGKTLGVVGESGCGKSTLGRMLVHLEESTDGQIFFEGEDVTHVKAKKLRECRDNMRMIFQDPYSSLNPRMSVSDTIREPFLLSKKYSKKEIDEETERLMDIVGIEPRLRVAFPHELDGGRRQRVGIARAIAMNPKFIVCDEPVSALDVSIQAQILNLLQDLQEKLGMAFMFVTHDLSVVRHISDEIYVMYLGQVVESAPAKELFAHPTHPYTKALLSAIPSMNIHGRSNRILLKGELTSPIEPDPGCRFAKRCPYATKECLEPQVLRELSPNHFAACHMAELS